ncbi:hypothetical protein [Peptoniphilus indolicus]|uniref:Uncharacterized protein n=2 Tax=Peptoniphilus indolicus TaxID=33030 RepID=G4D5F2_9FIRM|nr:hypothetical protein [Peptoniphilus indolicus]EGY78998.1 hypothetical protein HMPREF9129_1632 [Peptoniphilus indolicus ATCC 29427]SUB74369.1 Uncharacterised protein [Peptoniphilus indolicus]
MFKFTNESMVVKAWVNLIVANEKTLDDVPKLWNLKECVQDVLNSLKEEGGEIDA